MNIAVVGASNNPAKYGYRIVKALLEAGHRVFPVNPREKSILGQPVYARVADIESAIDIVDFVVPPEITLKILDEVRDLGRYNVWVQPGAESPEIIAFLDRHAADFGIITYNDCIETSLERRYSLAA